MVDEERPSKWALQNAAGVFELSELRTTLAIAIQQNLPSLPCFEKINKNSLFLDEKTVSILKLLGIDPTIKTVVENSHDHHEHTDDDVYTEGYNNQFYFLIKGQKGEENLHISSKDYYACNVLVIPHNNNPKEAKQKMEKWFELLEKYNYN